MTLLAYYSHNGRFQCRQDYLLKAYIISPAVCLLLKKWKYKFKIHECISFLLQFYEIGRNVWNVNIHVLKTWNQANVPDLECYAYARSARTVYTLRVIICRVVKQDLTHFQQILPITTHNIRRNISSYCLLCRLATYVHVKTSKIYSTSHLDFELISCLKAQYADSKAHCSAGQLLLLIQEQM